MYYVHSWTLCTSAVNRVGNSNSDHDMLYVPKTAIDERGLRKRLVFHYIPSRYFLRLLGDYVIIYDEIYDKTYEVIMRKLRISMEPFCDLKIE